MKVIIHLDKFGSHGLVNFVYLVKYANGNIKMVNASYFFNPEINEKFDKTETMIRGYFLSVLLGNQKELIN